jgi:hypothetical protein
MQENNRKQPGDATAHTGWPGMGVNGFPIPHSSWRAHGGGGFPGCCHSLREAYPAAAWFPWTLGAGWSAPLPPLSPEVAKQVELETLSAQLLCLDRVAETLRGRIRELGGHDPASIAGLP